MNDNDFEILEEYQSDNIYDLVRERKKNKAVDGILYKASIPKKYFYLEHYANGGFAKREIGIDYLDAVEDANGVLLSKEKQRSDSLFYSTLPMVLHYEGGYVNNPKDNGGETNMGITKVFLDTYKKKAGIKTNDIKKLTKDDAVKLYKAEWDIYGFGKLDNTDIMRLVYDFSVNSGPQTAIKYLQEALNRKGQNLKVDGYIGNNTNNAVNTVDENWLKKELQRLRAEHYDKIVDEDPEQDVFITGWFKRLNDIGNKYGCDTTFISRHKNRK